MQSNPSFREQEMLHHISALNTGGALNPVAPEFVINSALPFTGGALSGLNPDGYSHLFGSQSFPQEASEAFANPMQGNFNSIEASGWVSPEMSYDKLEEEIRKHYTAQCIEKNEHMVAVFNLDPKTTEKDLSDIFYPCGGNGAAIIASNASRKCGVVFFPTKRFSTIAIKKFNNFAPHQQSQFIVVRYCGPDPKDNQDQSQPPFATIPQEDLEYLLLMLRRFVADKKINLNRPCVSVHTLDQPSMESVFTYVRQNTSGSIIFPSWPSASSIEQRECSAQLKSSIRTSIIGFPTSVEAVRFITEVEANARATMMAVHAFPLGQDSQNPAVVTPIGFAPSANQLANGEEYGKFGTSFLGGTPGGHSQISRSELSPGLTISQTPKEENLQDILVALQQFTGRGEWNAVQTLLTKTINHPSCTEEEFRKASQIIVENLCDRVLCHRFEKFSETVLKPLHESVEHVEKTVRFLSQLGKDLLTVIVTQTTIPDKSRFMAGTLAVPLFQYGYLPSSPVQFASWTLSNLEPYFQEGTSGGPPDIKWIEMVISVVQHMIDTCSGMNQPPGAYVKFSEKKNQLLELCHSLRGKNTDSTPHKITLTPSSRPTPRPLVFRTSPSTGIGMRANNVSGFMGNTGVPPQVHLSSRDATSGVPDASGGMSEVCGEQSRDLDGQRQEIERKRTIFIMGVPVVLSDAQIRRLLNHFGEVNKVRVKKTKAKQGSSRNEGQVLNTTMFVEFATEEGAAAILDFFPAPGPKDFSFLDDERETEGSFPSSKHFLLNSIVASQAKSKIRGKVQSDAVFGFECGPENQTGKRVRRSPCTFGLEESQNGKNCSAPTFHYGFSHGTKILAMNTDPSPIKMTVESPGYDDDMEDIFEEAQRPPPELVFDHSIIDSTVMEPEDHSIADPALFMS